VFAYIVFKSRAHRGRVNAKVMKQMVAAGEQPRISKEDTWKTR
jgi:hypothetical protein